MKKDGKILFLLNVLLSITMIAHFLTDALAKFDFGFEACLIIISVLFISVGFILGRIIN